ncbi:hypothetical protein [Mucilaginibacter arboris]|uniref:Uncharacterized protein n=1 Tax=Mucilaginibacter arboris TaxID=2682090 RepID=A0A7K1SXI0_9SPHI|nr:hypothetical protein [Mucilaginibacter arboris]MVN22013.1 hypothetical protein [Mucilaginibacter arboris]
MKKILPILFFLNILTFYSAHAQSNQQKAQGLIIKYLSSKSNLKSNANINFSPIEVLRSSFADTKQYKNLLHKIDTLKLEGRKIDARIPKLKTTAEINQSKKDSKNLSDQLVATSDQLIDFMTAYKGKPVGWMIKTTYRHNTLRKKRFYLNQELTKVDSVR